MRHIHIVVAVSSAGQLFRQVCLSHPQLLTSALSVNWFERWDDMALLRVAFEGLKDMQVPMVTDEGTLKVSYVSQFISCSVDLLASYNS